VKRAIVAFVCGLVFGVGLIVSQMSNPAKVIGFLDITGDWDPSLALVMGGAVAVFGVLYRLALRQGTPLLAARFTLPEKDRLDAPLMVGAVIFGVGWGLGGFCPGPAIVSAAFGDTRVWAFVAAMIAGMVIYRIGLRRTHD
jgi:uncharacterized membrane protein YedE/YeeE